MTAFNTVRDIETWIWDHAGPQTTDADVKKMIEAIQKDPGRPNWEADWSDYLENLDLDTLLLVTLGDYANQREKVVLFWVSHGQPAGYFTPLGYPDIDFDERHNLLDLVGNIDETGWHWNGVGNPTDDRANTITRMSAFPDAEQWDSIVADYESEGI
jgi:hypothetical protein